MPGVDSSARQALYALKRRGFYIGMVTARSQPSEEYTRSQNAILFPDLFDVLHFSENKTLSPEAKRRTKAGICLDEGFGILIDDDNKNALSCAERGVYVLLFDKPWNKDCKEHQNIRRVYRGDEIVPAVLDRAGFELAY